jgi:hypothetical protein
MGLQVDRPAYNATVRGREFRPWMLATGAVLSALIAVLGMWGLVGYISAHAPMSAGCGDGCPTLSLGMAKPMASYNSSGEAYFPYGAVVKSVSPHVPVDNLDVSLTTTSGHKTGYAYAGVTSGSSGCWVGNYQSDWSNGMPSSAGPGASSCGSSGPTVSDPVAPGDTIVVATNDPAPALGASISVQTGSTTVNVVLP